jgi:hypothetical protein
MTARALAVAALMLALVGCDRAPNEPPKPPKVDAARLAKAEAAMDTCKKNAGLQDIPTPTGLVLDDPATRGQEMTPEMAGQLRLKVQCMLELNELLAARTP